MAHSVSISSSFEVGGFATKMVAMFCGIIISNSQIGLGGGGGGGDRLCYGCGDYLQIVA